MEHAADFRGALFLQNGFGVFVCLANMDDNGQPELFRQTDLLAEGLLLSLLRGPIAVVVQADLPDGHHMFVSGQGLKLCQGDGIELRCHMGMVSDDSEQTFIVLGKIN